jgi:hypothetical protein
MAKLPIRTWVRNAAAVFSGQHGAVTRQAEQSQCSRETLYQHACKVEQRLANVSQAEAELRAENQQLREVIAQLQRQAKGWIGCDKIKQRQLATTAFAMGVSLRQVEDLLRVLLPADEVPDHSTLGHWLQAEADRARRVLETLDPACAGRVRTLAIDEIFFGGDRPWLASNRRA